MRWRYILLLVAACFGVYANSIPGSFVADDDMRWRITDTGADWSIQSESREILAPTPGGFYRPIPYLLHAIDYRLWGNNPVGFHITNILLHAIVTILVYSAGSLLLRDKIGPLIVALLFATHPVHTEAVTYIAGRTDVTAAAFFVLSFLLYARSRSVSGRAAYLTYAGAVLAFLMALMCKEAAIVLPFVLALYEFYFLPGGRSERIHRRLVYPFAPLAIAGLLYGLVVFSAGGGKPFSFDRIGLGLQALTAARAYHQYLQLLIYPADLSFMHDFPWTSSISEPAALVSLAVVALLVSSVFLVCRLSKIVSFGLAWVVVTILPVSNLFIVTRLPLPLMAERYLYIPSVGFCIGAGYMIQRLRCIPASSRRRRLYAGVGSLSLIALLITYSALTIERNLDWQSQYILAKRTIEQNPKAAMAHVALGGVYTEQGRYDEAIEEYVKALALNPTILRARVGLATVYERKGEYEKAIRQLKTATSNHTGCLEAHHLLGSIYCRTGRLDDGFAQYRKALALNPNDANVHNSLGNAHLMSGDVDRAISEYRMALSINPRLVQAYVNLAAAYARTGRTEEAMEECRRALAVDPECAEVRSCLGGILLVMGRSDEALAEFHRALAINPSLRGAHVNLARIYSQKGEYDLAIDHCDRAIELGAPVDPGFLELLKPHR